MSEIELLDLDVSVLIKYHDIKLLEKQNFFGIGTECLGELGFFEDDYGENELSAIDTILDTCDKDALMIRNLMKYIENNKDTLKDGPSDHFLRMADECVLSMETNNKLLKDLYCTIKENKKVTTVPHIATNAFANGIMKELIGPVTTLH